MSLAPVRLPCGQLVIYRNARWGMPSVMSVSLVPLGYDYD